MYLQDYLQQMGIGHLELRETLDGITPYWHSHILLKKEFKVVSYTYSKDYPLEKLYAECSDVLAKRLGYHQVVRWEST